MAKLRWPVLFAVGSAFIILTMILSAPVSVHSLAAVTSTPTGLNVPQIGAPTRTATATPLRERSGLASPTPTPTEVLPEAVQTLNALNNMLVGTLENRPTWTPGPSAIALTGKPHFVKFYTDWCPACRRMEPHVRVMKQKYSDQITFWDINTDNPSSLRLAIQHDIQFIPVIVLLNKQGKPFERLEGYQTADELEAAIEALLAAVQ